MRFNRGFDFYQFEEFIERLAIPIAAFELIIFIAIIRSLAVYITNLIH